MKVWSFLLCLFLRQYPSAQHYLSNASSLHTNNQLVEIILLAFQVNSTTNLDRILYERDVGISHFFRKSSGIASNRLPI